MKNSIILTCLLFITFNIRAQNETNPYNVDDSKIAVAGYDVVSYFKDQKASKGNKDFSVVANGITYLFVNQNHKDAFIKNTSFYQPQFGGWCAYAIGKSGEKVTIDPKTFKIIDNKLYLFYNKYFTNTLNLWNKDEKVLLTQANKNWRKMIKNKIE